MQLDAERLNRMIAGSREKCSDLSVTDPDKLKQIDKELDIDFADHFEYQKIQSEFHAEGILTSEAAQVVYIALGEVGSQNNGGWAKGTDTATKFTVTKLIQELLDLKIKRAQAKQRSIF